MHRKRFRLPDFAHLSWRCLTERADRSPWYFLGVSRWSLFCELYSSQSCLFRRRKKGVITKGVLSLEESLESLKSLNSLESLENGRILLYFPESVDPLKSLESLESLENGLFWKDPFSKGPLFPNPTISRCLALYSSLLRAINGC